MRIAVIAPTLKIYGGGEKVAALLSRALVERGFDVSMVTFYDAPHEHEHGGARVRMSESPREPRLLKLLRRPWRIARFCRRNDVDVMIGVLEEANFVCILSRLLGNRSRMVASIHQDAATYGPVFRFLLRVLHRRADAVVACSEALAEQLRDQFGLDNVRVIRNPVDAERESAEAGTLPGSVGTFVNGRFTFVTIGRLVPKKAQHRLLRSFREVARRHPQSCLLVLGEGELERPLRRLRDELGLSAHVELLGNRTDIYTYLHAGDCFVLSSQSEAFGIVLVEAMLAGLPVVSTDCFMGPREVLAPGTRWAPGEHEYPEHADYGVLTEPWDADPGFTSDPPTRVELQLADAMCRMVEEPPLRERYCDKKRRAADFDIASVVKPWIATLETVAPDV